jgi:hypothetical protein
MEEDPLAAVLTLDEAVRVLEVVDDADHRDADVGLVGDRWQVRLLGLVVGVVVELLVREPGRVEGGRRRAQLRFDRDDRGRHLRPVEHGRGRVGRRRRLQLLLRLDLMTGQRRRDRGGM